MVALIMIVIIIKDEGDLVKQCERDCVSERPLQDGVVLPWYHLIIAIVITKMMMLRRRRRRKKMMKQGPLCRVRHGCLLRHHSHWGKDLPVDGEDLSIDHLCIVFFTVFFIYCYHCGKHFPGSQTFWWLELGGWAHPKGKWHMKWLKWCWGSTSKKKMTAKRVNWMRQVV